MCSRRLTHYEQPSLAQPRGVRSALHTGHAFGVGVDVEIVAAREADQRDAGLMREIDGERRRRRNRDDDADPGEPGLLYYVERDAPADGKRVWRVLRRGQQQGANALVHRVVAADIFRG